MAAPTIDRTNYNNLVDDDGTNTVGTNWSKNQVKICLLDPIDTLVGVIWDNSICDGRLTLTTATPVTTADVTAAVTLYFTPYRGCRISLYDGVSVWNTRTFAELNIAVPAAASQMYDVFVYDNAGAPTLETLAWTNDTTRATALVLQDGVLVKSGATTRRYVGSFRTTTVAGQTEDSAAKRYVWNYYNRVPKPMRVVEVGNWNYTTATFRQANANTANQLDVVNGFAEEPIDVSLAISAYNTNTGVRVMLSIGEDSTTVPSTSVIDAAFDTSVVSTPAFFCARLIKVPAVGRHTYVWLEKSQASGTTTWRADLTGQGTGLTGGWRC